VLACPLVVVNLVGGAHNDALTIGLLMAAIAVIVTRYDRMSGLIISGALIGLSIAIKPTILVAVPFVALYAAGGADVPGGPETDAHPLVTLARLRGGLRSSLRCDAQPPVGELGRHPMGHGPLGFPPISDMLERGGAVLISALVALGVPTLISGLGFGWVSALIHAGGEPSWTSPSTSVGTSLDALLRVFGVHVNLVPATRDIGLGLMVIALILIFWRARYADRFYAAGLALLAVTFFAPIAQPWYLIWPLVMIAITNVRARWFYVAVVVACFAAMPDGVGLDGLARLPLSIAVALTAIWGVVQGIAWLRGNQPHEYPRRDRVVDLAGKLR